ncbi:molybdenum cofactor cytidylyltransferase [Cognatiyoonia koreensis]|uniref:Molybdenum cofactor cytidylyltransferase n=1 Tax=Cognatiyoonia koreensis TaxID=364200 RepID=A0A1I0PS36_9RHOB|nr:molybdopterin-binding protein [Cognatiyoonia koreensis]SEW17094.1 molybdenum cofactor cytidylyltransferase [Cognatiyoonia koreensis]
MKFGPVPVNDALGAIAAYSMRAGGRTIKKGAVLTKADLSHLETAGLSTITVARLDADDLHEDEAASAIANALVPDGPAVHLRLSRAATGRVNLFATNEGIVVFDPERINALNAVDPMITVATVPPYHRLPKDGMVATIKIISYGVAKTDIARACTLAPQVALAVGQYSSITLIETKTDNPMPSTKGRDALAVRVNPLGISLTDRVVVAHEIDALSTALQEAKGDVICILTASATSDAHDVAPSAVRRAGGAVARFGMPVDPGNLLFVGNLGEKPIVGLPGCARSPALNGADWVLNRILCGVPVTSDDIAAMGVGGLLKEIPTRPRPRAG